MYILVYIMYIFPDVNDSWMIVFVSETRRIDVGRRLQGQRFSIPMRHATFKVEADQRAVIAVENG